jgi:uncharacterized protein YcfJ
MKSKIMIAAIAAAVATPMVASAPAEAQRYSDQYYYGDHQRNAYDRAYQNGYNRPHNGDYRNYRGRDVRYYQDCRRSSGTTGLIAGGAGGALIGNALGGGTLGTLLGAVGGGLLGKHLDKQHDAEQNYRNGC